MAVIPLTEQFLQSLHSLRCSITFSKYMEENSRSRFFGNVIFGRINTFFSAVHNCGKTGNFAIPFKIEGDGKRAISAINITAAPDCFIGFSLRFANEGRIKLYALELQ